MFSFFRKICHAFLIFVLAIVFSYFFFSFFPSAEFVFFAGDKLIAATHR